MEQEKQPLLTIGIIFKNEIRSLERCLEALRPLRERISCELILGDTGSTDGSREIAEKYADKLIDFPWVNDFAAARNAVIGKAAGSWYLTVDTDEYLDADVSELVGFLEAETCKSTAASLLVRNYETMEMAGDYADFLAVRLVKLLPGVHYEGAIHEQFILPEGANRQMTTLARTILHHDGYAKTTPEKEREKKERNRALLKEKLTAEPENLSDLVHYIESSRGQEDYLDMVRLSVRLVEEKRPGWEYFGPAVYRNAVRAAYEESLSEFEQWSKRAVELFGGSLLVKIDVECYICAQLWNMGDLTACAESGERYLAAIEEYRAGSGERESLFSSVLFLASPAKERQTRLFLAEAYIKLGEYTKAERILPPFETGLVSGKRNEEQVGELLWLERAAQEAVKAYDWTGNGEGNPEGLALAYLFTRVEEGALPAFYKAEVLCEEKIVELPAEKRFAWYCIRAFASLNGGDLPGYVRQLKEGLLSFGERKAMVEYLLENTPGLRREEPSEELLALAKQVRAFLALYPADAPEVMALKTTPAYQKVAWLIEGRSPAD